MTAAAAGAEPLTRLRVFATKYFVDLQRDEQVLHNVQNVLLPVAFKDTFLVKDSFLQFRISPIQSLKDPPPF